MRRLAIPLSAAALSIGIAACGTSGGSTTTAGTTAPSKQVAPASGTTTTSGANRRTEQFAAKTQRTIQQIAAASGQLATGHSTSEQMARATLGRLQRQAQHISASARTTLAPSNPARPLLVQIATQASNAAGRLRGARVTPTTKSTFLRAERNLDSLARSIGQVRPQLAQANLATITSDLQSLARRLGLTGSSTSYGG